MAVSSNPPGVADSEGSGDPSVPAQHWSSALCSSSLRFLMSLLGAPCRGVVWA